MIYLTDPTEFHHMAPTVVTIGKFDGVHRGHQVLMRRTIELARSSDDPRCASVAVILDGSRRRILTRQERVAYLKTVGIDYVIEMPLSDELKNQSAESFVNDFLLGTLHAEAVIVGEDFRFGKGRRGDVAMLKECGRELEFVTEEVMTVRDDGIRISSTEIRARLSEGNMEKVNRYLGYSFFLSGTIVHGRHLGHTLGVPTTNLVPAFDKLLPPNGVYASAVEIGGRTYHGMTNIGTRPTVSGIETGVETHLFDVEEDLYGKEEKVELLHYTRPEADYGSLEALKARLMKDKDEIRAWFARNGY